MIKEKLCTEDFDKLLKSGGLKITPARLAVLDIFSKNHKPISADMICKKLDVKINEATVYRMVSSFEEKGLIKRVDLRRESVYFELNNDHHHHIVCVNCGVLEDFKENKEIEKILESVIKKSTKFIKIKEHSLELFGFCKACN